MKNKILTVTIPSYNTQNYIDDCLPTFLDESILELIEILIVNDGSKDNTLEIAKKYEIKYPKTIRVIDKENGGHGSTINFGLQEASGLFFKVVDGDDWVNTQEFVSFVNQLKNCEDYDLLLNPFTIVNDKNKEKSLVSYSDLHYNKSYDADEVYSLKDNIQMHSITYKTNVIKDNNILLDENMFYVDQEYNLFPIPFVKKALYLSQNVYQYRIFTDTQSMNYKNLHKNREMHKNVFLNLNTYFQANIDLLSLKKKQYYLRCISNMAFLQIMIYLSMATCEDSYDELYEFLEQIKSIDLDWGLASPVISLFKKTNFRFYTLFSKYVRIRMKKSL